MMESYITFFFLKAIRENGLWVELEGILSHIYIVDSGLISLFLFYKYGLPFILFPIIKMFKKSKIRNTKVRFSNQSVNH